MKIRQGKVLSIEPQTDVYTNAFFKNGITNSTEFGIKNSCYCFQFGIKNSIPKNSFSIWNKEFYANITQFLLASSNRNSSAKMAATILLSTVTAFLK